MYADRTKIENDLLDNLIEQPADRFEDRILHRRIASLRKAFDLAC